MFGLEDLDMFSSRTQSRDEKSLLNTFPFNQEHEHHHHAGDHAKVQHNSLFPFKAAEEIDDIEDTTDTVTDTEVNAVTIDDFQEEELEVGSLDLNSVGAASQQDEDVATARKCIDKVFTRFYC